MNAAAAAAGLAVVALAARDVLYRIFVIRPRTDVSGAYAAMIEEPHTARWVGPVVCSPTAAPPVLFVGNSHVMDAIDPKVVSERAGVGVFNVAVYSAVAADLLELLDEYGHSPAIVLADFSTRYSTSFRRDEVRRELLAAAQSSKSDRAHHELMDRVHWLAPSLFVPRGFRPILRRCVRKYRGFRRTGRASIGRYTPFKPLVSYEWRLHKATNHRTATRVHPMTRFERESERYLLEKSIGETSEFCDPESRDYIETMDRVRSSVAGLRSRGTTVVLMRLPLHDELVRHEDEHFGRYFDELQSLAEQTGAEYLDLTQRERLDEIGEVEFYSDGQHVLHPSDIVLSRYLGGLIRDYLDASTPQ